jgi:hypothetical protein
MNSSIEMVREKCGQTGVRIFLWLNSKEGRGIYGRRGNISHQPSAIASALDLSIAEVEDSLILLFIHRFARWNGEQVKAS